MGSERCEMQKTDNYNAATPPRRARPAWLPTLVTVLMLPLLIGLGLWQLDRADYKRTLQADFAAAGEASRLETRDEVRSLDGLRRFQPVALSGRYVDERQFLLESMIYDGAAGYHVLTPFVTDAGPVIVINRGWVAKDYGGGKPEVTVGADARRIAGRVARLPRPAIAVGETSVDDGWPKAVHFPDAAALAELLGQDLDGRELLTPIVLLGANQDDGYVRDWQPTGTGPERHLAYALQWFAFAATLAVIWLVMFRRGRRNKQ